MAREAQNASELQKKLAEENAALASAERIKAEKNAKEAERLRYKALAQTLAVKSLQLRDSTLKAQVALQGYQFNSKYNENELNPDIYSGLYYSQKLLEGDNFNTFNELDEETGFAKNAGNKNVIRSLHIKDDKLYSLSSDGMVKIWNPSTRRLIETYNLNPEASSKRYQISNYARTLLNTSGGETYAGLSNGKIMNIDSKRIIYAHENPVVDMVEINGKLLSWSWRGISENQEELNLVSLVDLASGKISNEVEVKEFGHIIEFQILQNVAYALSTSERDHKTRILKWTDLSATPEVIIEEVGGLGTSFAISQNRRYLIVGYQSGNINLFDLGNQKLIQNMTGHYAGVGLLKFSPNGKFLISGSLDNTARIWDVTNPNNPLIYLDDHESWVWSATFSENSERVFVGLSDGTLKTYSIGTVPMANKITQNIEEKLSEREWNQFVGKDIPYPYK